MNKNDLQLNDFPLKTYDKIRYVDTDRQGHVNNAVFSSFFETGRVEILYNSTFPLINPETSFVIATIKLDFLDEIQWPGQIEIGTGVLKIGNSSITLFQKLFQNGRSVADAETTIVQIHSIQKKSYPLNEPAKTTLKNWLLKC